MAEAAASMLNSPRYQEMMRRKAEGADQGETPVAPAEPAHGGMLDTEYYRKRMAGETTPETEAPQGPPEPVDYKTMGAGEVAMRGVQALPSSLGKMAGDIGYAVTHLPEVGGALLNLGEGAVSKTAGALGFEQDKAQKAKSETTLDALFSEYAKRYGSMEGFKEAVATDPVSVLRISQQSSPGWALARRRLG